MLCVFSIKNSLQLFTLTRKIGSKLKVFCAEKFIMAICIQEKSGNILKYRADCSVERGNMKIDLVEVIFAFISTFT